VDVECVGERRIAVVRSDYLQEIRLTVPYHRFISVNEAHTDNAKIKQEDRKFSGQKTQKKEITKHKTIKTKSELEYTSTQLHCVSKKTTMTFYAITSMHINRI